jgi:hypothetical protein
MMKFIRGMLLFIPGFLTLVAFNKIQLHYNWPEALKRTVMTPFVGTLWANGFSEAQFEKVRIGMLEAQVKELLGEPLKEWRGKMGYAWLYSWQDTPTADYDRRWVSFDAKGAVVEVRHEFHID